MSSNLKWETVQTQLPLKTIRNGSSLVLNFWLFQKEQRGWFPHFKTILFKFYKLT